MEKRKTCFLSQNLGKQADFAKYLHSCLVGVGLLRDGNSAGISEQKGLEFWLISKEKIEKEKKKSYTS